MKAFRFSLCVLLTLLFLSPIASARSSKKMTIGALGMGNIQLVETNPELDPGPGGGVYFDYRFNQRFSLSVDMWATIHDGSGASSGDDSIIVLGIPTATLKVYFLDDEQSRWDPYAGIGLGVFALTEGTVGNGTNGLGLGAQIDLGVDYLLTDIFSVGFSGIFRSVGIINSLDNNNSTALIPFSLVGRFGFHF